MTKQAAGRPIGRETRVSAVTLGTMRLGGVGEVADATALLRHAASVGIVTVHCSSEYDSFPLFRAAWRKSRLAVAGVGVIAKVAAPHYGEDRFSGAQLRAKVEAYLGALAIDRIEVVQWLLRYDLKQDAARRRILHDAAAELADTVAGLKREGKIGAFVGFPYTLPIAEVLIDAGYCDGLALYVNPLEREMDAAVAACAQAGKAVIAIRPFAAGRLFAETDTSADQAMQYALGRPGVATVVVSASSRAHVDALRPYLSA
ncbi:aldo/keto reductase [Sphingomonas sp.]|uniref:aldo/keto reductase n=1 Tax=Sphingomonas sp. TaxID=28214 RepID=UPI0035BC90B1